MAYGKLIDRFPGSIVYLLFIIVQGENDILGHDVHFLFSERRPQVCRACVYRPVNEGSGTGVIAIYEGCEVHDQMMFEFLTGQTYTLLIRIKRPVYLFYVKLSTIIM